MPKKIPAAIPASIITLVFIYAAIWFYIAGKIDENISQIYQNSTDQGFIISGERPAISGFPGAHRISFSGSVEQGAYSLAIPQILLTGDFLRGTRMILTLDKGILLQDAQKQEVFSIDYISMEGRALSAIPYELKSYMVKKNNLLITGSGWLSIDDEQQPTGVLKAKVSGSLPFLEWLESKKMVEENSAKIAKMLINGLEKEDAETGLKSMDTTISLRSRTLYLGPLKLLDLPDFRKDMDNQPARHQ
jgi:hypothetical protein